MECRQVVANKESQYVILIKELVAAACLNAKKTISRGQLHEICISLMYKPGAKVICYQ